MNGVLHLCTTQTSEVFGENGQRGQGLHQWLGLGNKGTLVEVRESLWFQLNIDEHVRASALQAFSALNYDRDLSP